MSVFIEKSQLRDPAVVLDIDVKDETARAELAKRVDATKKVTPELVTPEKIHDIRVYKRFSDTDKKEEYRRDLIKSLCQEWSKTKPQNEVQYLKNEFLQLTERLDETGAAVFAEILDKESFKLLIEEYTRVLKESGSESWIHSYVNLANHPEYLTNDKFNKAFLHPLLIALVSFRVGGPIRVVDGRGKDAKPLKVLAQDNMLHIDNTPFNDEYKVIVTWERGKPSGPRGQNFVFLPGTQKGSRQCMVGKQGPWSSENASIFITPESIEQVFKYQEEVLGKRAVVELTHDTKPLTTLFQAGALVHHRYRTAQGLARSCMILAFHRAEDNPGQLVADKHLLKTSARTNSLYQHLFGYHGKGSTGSFLEALAKHANDISDLITNINDPKHSSEEIVPGSKELTAEEVVRWKRISTAAPTVEQKKVEANAFLPRGKAVTKEEFVDQVAKIMVFDKHGPLDLILYPDAHEEIRKWARNQIREKQIPELKAQLQMSWAARMKSPEFKDLMTTEEMKRHCDELAKIAEEHLAAGAKGAVLKKGEKITPRDAFRSVKQLLIDLGESVVRCEDRTALLSTSLFIFWATDTLMRLSGKVDQRVKEAGDKLLANYVVTSMLVKQEIDAEAKK